MGLEQLDDSDLPQIDPEEAQAILRKGKQLFIEFGKEPLPEKPDMDISCLVIATASSMIHDLGLPPIAVAGGPMNSLIKIALRAAYKLGERDTTRRATFFVIRYEHRHGHDVSLLWQAHHPTHEEMVATTDGEWEEGREDEFLEATGPFTVPGSNQP